MRRDHCPRAETEFDNRFPGETASRDGLTSLAATGLRDMRDQSIVILDDNDVGSSFYHTPSALVVVDSCLAPFHNLFSVLLSLFLHMQHMRVKR